MLLDIQMERCLEMSSLKNRSSNTSFARKLPGQILTVVPQAFKAVPYISGWGSVYGMNGPVKIEAAISVHSSDFV